MIPFSFNILINSDSGVTFSIIIFGFFSFLPITSTIAFLLTFTSKFSSYGWKILIQLYNKLKENHEGSFHDANGFDDAYITDIIQELIELDYNIKPIFVKGNWLEIDTTQDLEIASKKLD